MNKTLFELDIRSVKLPEVVKPILNIHAYLNFNLVSTLYAKVNFWPMNPCNLDLEIGILLQS